MALSAAQQAILDHTMSTSKDRLISMTDPERKEFVHKVVKRLSTKTDDELISILSTNSKDVSPEILQRKEIVEAASKMKGGSILMGTKLAPGELEPFQKEVANIEQLQSLGVKTGEPLPAGSAEIGFAADPIEAIKGALSKHFGKSTMVFKRGEDILYLNPQTRSVERVEPNMMQALGLTLPVAGDIGGTIAGGLIAGGTTKSPAAMVAGEAAGSTVGTTTGEALRLMIGKWAGANDLSYPDIFKKAGITGLKAGAGTGAIGSVLASAKGVSNFFKGGIFTKHDAMLHGLNSKEADAVLGEINKLLAKKGVKGQVKGTLGRMTSDVSTVSKEAELRNIGEFAQKFVERDAKDQKMLLKAFEAVTGKTGKKGAPKAAEVLAKQVGKKVAKGKEIVAANVKQLETELANIGRVSKELVGEPTRAILLRKSEAAQRAQQNVWKKLKADNGFNESTQAFGIPIPKSKETQALAKIMKRRAETATTKGTARSASNIFTGKKKSADLNDFNREISNLKADIRSAKKGRQFGDPQINNLNETLTALVDQRRLALMKSGNEKLLKSIEAAEKKTAEFHKTYNRSIVGDLTKKGENDLFEIQGKDFVNKILKGSPDEAQQLINAIGDKPTLMAMWKEGVSDAYKQAAFKSGKFNREASTKFLKSHKPVLDKFFGADDIAKLEKTGALSEKIAKQSAQLKEFTAVANKKWGRGKLKSLDPNNLVNFVTNNTGSFIKGKGMSEQGIQVAVNKIKYVKGFLKKNHPAAWQELKDNFSEQIRKASIDIKTKEVSAASLNKIVSNQKDEIIELMGKDYYKDLVKVNNAVQLAGKKLTKLSDQEVKQGVLAVARAVVAPPLTRRGRALTAANIFETRWARRKIADALLDQSTIRKVAEAAEHKTLTRQAAELYISLGLIGED